MKVNNGKDFWAGLMYLGFGGAFFAVAQNYNMGSALRMGPAYFPTVLGGLLFLLGVAVVARSFASKIHHPLKLFPFDWRLFAVALAIGIPAFIWQRELFSWGGQWTVWIINGAGILAFFAAFGKRSLYQVLVMTILFGYLLRPAGLVVTTFLLLFGAAAAGYEFKFKEVLIMSIVLSTASSLAFVKGLGLPFPIWPEFLMS